MTRLYLLIFLILPVLGLAGNGFADQSVLATGNWYKIAVNQTGIHKVTYDDLVQLGMDPSSFNPTDIRLYGNGGGMLPETNSQFRIDDLLENSIIVIDGGDGQFNPGDYFIFYGEEADAWNFDEASKTFSHKKNIYSDFTYYKYAHVTSPFINAIMLSRKKTLIIVSSLYLCAIALCFIYFLQFCGIAFIMISANSLTTPSPPLASVTNKAISRTDG